MAKQKSYSWTKDAMKKVIALWETKNTDQIATELGINRPQVNYIASIMRKNGIPLPKKTIISHHETLVKELKAEMGL